MYYHVQHYYIVISSLILIVVPFSASLFISLPYFPPTLILPALPLSLFYSALSKGRFTGMSRVFICRAVWTAAASLTVRQGGAGKVWKDGAGKGSVYILMNVQVRVSAGILKGCQGFAQCICARQNTVERRQQFFIFLTLVCRLFFLLIHVLQYGSTAV